MVISLSGKFFDKGAIAVVCEEEPEELPGPCIRVEDSLVASADRCVLQRADANSDRWDHRKRRQDQYKEFVASVLAQKYNIQDAGQFQQRNRRAVDTACHAGGYGGCRCGDGHQSFRGDAPFKRDGKAGYLRDDKYRSMPSGIPRSRDGILKAKSEIFDFMNPEGTVCVNGDDDKLMTIGEVHGKSRFTLDFLPKTIFTQTPSQAVDCWAVQRQSTRRTLRLTYRFRCRGAYGVKCAGGDCSWFTARTDDRADPARNRRRAGSKRQKPVVQAGDLVLIDDCYNANPVSTKVALDLLSLAEGRKVAVLGDMFELERRKGRCTGRLAHMPQNKA